MTTPSEWDREVSRAKAQIRTRLWRAAQLLAIAAVVLGWRLAEDGWGPKALVYTTFRDVGLDRVAAAMEMGIVALAVVNAVLCLMIARNLHRLVRLKTGRAM